MKVYKKPTKKVILATLLVVLIVLAGYITFAYTTKDAWPFKDSSQPALDTDDINYAPPTDTEVEASQDGKKNSANEGTEVTTVSVDLSYASLTDDKTALDIRAFTTDIIEGSGTCKATLKYEDTIVSGTSKAFVDASSSICEPIVIPLNKFPYSGTWSLTVQYKSSTHSGISVPVLVEVTL